MMDLGQEVKRFWEIGFSVAIKLGHYTHDEWGETRIIRFNANNFTCFLDESRMVERVVSVKYTKSGMLYTKSTIGNYLPSRNDSTLVYQGTSKRIARYEPGEWEEDLQFWYRIAQRKQENRVDMENGR